MTCTPSTRRLLDGYPTHLLICAQVVPRQLLWAVPARAPRLLPAGIVRRRVGPPGRNRGILGGRRSVASRLLRPRAAGRDDGQLAALRLLFVNDAGLLVPVWKSNSRCPTPSTRRHPNNLTHWLISTQVRSSSTARRGRGATSGRCSSRIIWVFIPSSRARRRRCWSTRTLLMHC